MTDERLVNQDGIDVTDIVATYDILEQIRENARDDGLEDLTELMNEAHCQVQEYDERSDWTYQEQ